jgi:hypothetical protein
MSKPRISWQCFPKSTPCPEFLMEVIGVFESKFEEIASLQNVGQASNDVLAHLREGFEFLGFLVEKGKTTETKIRVPVLYGANGKVEKAFDADAYHPLEKVVIEVEAGRAVTNYQFLKDLFQACVMQDVDYLVIAVRQDYRGGDDYSKVIAFLETLYAGTRLQLPLKGVLIVGY